jgi:hypothetical protein
MQWISYTDLNQLLASRLLEKLIECNIQGQKGYSMGLTICQTTEVNHNNVNTSTIPTNASYLTKWIPTKKSSALYLHVLASNTSAIQFYEKHQFQKIRLLKNYYYIDGQYRDAFLYALFINGGKPPSTPLKQIR